ncbi:hypothetical protein [Anatilimnocola aggregata]|uniref:hypothetical protein n=1 Tax=Anatilimnocola aggregata TaxID=2528021 RepID=UPI0011A7FDEF|nr:hypothetical protein [Anatilimnocola aggregata]
MSSIRADSAGGVVITDNGGTASALSPTELPLKGMERFYFQPRPTSFDYLAGRYHFPLVTSGPDTRGELKEPVHVSAVATSRGIIIISVQ